MKHLITLTGLLALLVLTACGGGNRAKAQEAQKEEETMTETKATGWDNLPEEPVFEIVTTMGSIKVKLYGDTPKHRDNFVKLVKQGYYDGVLFHRVIKGFMIQTGDPLSKDSSMSDKWGTGGPNYTIPAEILPNHSHIKGALAAARRGDAANPMKASSGSQFYIVHDAENCKHLDGEYSIFGETIEGFDVIDKIAEVTTDNRDRPLMNVKILKISLVEAVENGANEVENGGNDAENKANEVENGEKEKAAETENTETKTESGTDIAVKTDE